MVAEPIVNDADGAHVKVATLSILAVLLVSPAYADNASLTERGEYLVKVAACRGCHTPRDAGAAALSGGTRFGNGPSAVVAPNITPDAETGIGSWSEQQIITAIRQGLRPDGTHIRPPMPQAAYRTMSDRDAEAIAAFLKSVPPVHNAVAQAATEARPPQHNQPSSAVVPDAPAGDAVARGRYIANSLAHCTECHDRSPEAATQTSNETAHVFRGPWGAVAAPDITAAVLARFTDAELAGIITKGVRPDGSTLVGPMPIAGYASLTSDDLAAVIAYLRDPAH